MINYYLFNFRETANAMTADIEQRFLLVKVKKTYELSETFISRCRKPKNDKIKIFNYNRNIFGARNSQNCSNYAFTKSLKLTTFKKFRSIYIWMFSYTQALIK